MTNPIALRPLLHAMLHALRPMLLHPLRVIMDSPERALYKISTEILSSERSERGSGDSRVI